MALAVNMNRWASTVCTAKAKICFGMMTTYLNSFRYVKVPKGVARQKTFLVSSSTKPGNTFGLNFKAKEKLLSACRVLMLSCTTEEFLMFCMPYFLLLTNKNFEKKLWTWDILLHYLLSMGLIREYKDISNNCFKTEKEEHQNITLLNISYNLSSYQELTKLYPHYNWNTDNSCYLSNDFLSPWHTSCDFEMISLWRTWM